MTGEEYEKLCNKLTAADSQSFEWERAAGGHPVRIDDQLVYATGARTACHLDDNGNLIRRLPPECPLKRAKLIVQYWTMRLETTKGEQHKQCLVKWQKALDDYERERRKHHATHATASR